MSGREHFFLNRGDAQMPVLREAMSSGTFVLDADGFSG
jgi:hypothetical protein